MDDIIHALQLAKTIAIESGDRDAVDLFRAAEKQAIAYAAGNDVIMPVLAEAVHNARLYGIGWIRVNNGDPTVELTSVDPTTITVRVPDGHTSGVWEWHG